MKINESEIKKILILQYKPFGDVLLNTGYLPFLKKKFPGAKIDFLVEKPYDIVLQGNPNINELIVYEKRKGPQYLINRLKVILEIRRRKYDVILDQLKGTGSGIITLFSGAKYRIGFDNHKFSWVHNITVKESEPKYTAARKFALLRPLGIEEESFDVEIYIKKEAEEYIAKWLRENNLSDKKFVCVAPGSPVKSKKWNAANYARVCDRIIGETDFEVVLIGAPSEKGDIRKVVENMKREPVIADTPDFHAAAALLKKASFLLCNDGGINHLSVAVKTPSLAMFGKTDPIFWSAYETGEHFYIKKENCDYENNDSFCIEPEEVFAKFTELISSEKLLKKKND